MTKRFGFTLAEVLVTLTIIGVVASMTVPTLMNNTGTQEMTASYKKAMSTLNQAITMQYALEGTDMRDFDPNRTTRVDADDEETLAWMLRNRLQVTRHLDDIKTARDKNWTGGGGVGAADTEGMYLADGSLILFPNDAIKSAYCVANGDAEAENFNENAAGGEIAENLVNVPNNECLYSIIVDVNGDRGTCAWRNSANGTRNGDRLNPGDCFIVDVYPDGVRPGDWMGTRLLYGSQRNDVNPGGGEG